MLTDGVLMLLGTARQFLSAMLSVVPFLGQLEAMLWSGSPRTRDAVTSMPASLPLRQGALLALV
eukprot:21393-Amphidinium_carterae.1